MNSNNKKNNKKFIDEDDEIKTRISDMHKSLTNLSFLKKNNNLKNQLDQSFDVFNMTLNMDCTTTFLNLVGPQIISNLDDVISIIENKDNINLNMIKKLNIFNIIPNDKFDTNSINYENIDSENVYKFAENCIHLAKLYTKLTSNE